jgi:hypothetical protein
MKKLADVLDVCAPYPDDDIAFLHKPLDFVVLAESGIDEAYCSRKPSLIRRRTETGE